MGGQVRSNPAIFRFDYVHKSSLCAQPKFLYHPRHTHRAMWERQRHARETAAYLLQQEQQRQQMRLEGGMLLEVDLGHCRPRSMLESAAAQDAMDAASPPGHNATKKKPALLSSLSLHAMAADGNLAGLGRRLNGKSFSPPTHEVEAQAWTEKSPPVGLSPLMLAVMCSDHATVDFLLSHGGCGDPRVGGGKGDMTVVVPSPAHVAAARDPSSLLSLLDLPEEGEGLRQEVLRATDGAFFGGGFDSRFDKSLICLIRIE